MKDYELDSLLDSDILHGSSNQSLPEEVKGFKTKDFLFALLGAYCSVRLAHLLLDIPLNGSTNRKAGWNKEHHNMLGPKATPEQIKYVERSLNGMPYNI